MRLAILWGLFLSLLSCCQVAAEPSQDILIVGNSTSPKMHDFTEQIRSKLIHGRLQFPNMEPIPVDFYDYDRPGHRLAVQRLGIKPTQLPFVGLCVLTSPGGSPLKVLEGQGPVHDMAEAGLILLLATCDIQARARGGDAADRQVISQIYTTLANVWSSGKSDYLFDFVTPDYVEMKGGRRFSRAELAPLIPMDMARVRRKTFTIRDLNIQGDDAVARVHVRFDFKDGSSKDDDVTDTWHRTRQGWRLAQSAE